MAAGPLRENGVPCGCYRLLALTRLQKATPITNFMEISPSEGGGRKILPALKCERRLYLCISMRAGSRSDGSLPSLHRGTGAAPEGHHRHTQPREPLAHSLAKMCDPDGAWKPPGSPHGAGAPLGMEEPWLQPPSSCLPHAMPRQVPAPSRLPQPREHPGHGLGRENHGARN